MIDTLKDEQFMVKMYTVLADIVERCMENQVKLIIDPADSVMYNNDGFPCSGYFLGFYNTSKEKQRILSFATGKPMIVWAGVALHESSHMDQFIEKCPAWLNTLDGDEENDKVGYFFNWLAGADMDNVDELARLTLEVELDCEKRTVDKLHRYGLTDFIDPETYTQQANAYIYLYLYMLESRKWPEKSIYTIEEIWKVAPKNFDNDYTKIPPELYEAFQKHLY